MKFFRKAKDGGPQSTVTGYWLIEWKRFFSIVLLRFDHGSRDEFHDHAFGSLNWVLQGKVTEQEFGGEARTYTHIYRPSWCPVVTRRDTFHRVVSDGTTWVFSIRGPWTRYWQEWCPKTKRVTTLTHGRKTVSFDVESHKIDSTDYNCGEMITHAQLLKKVT